MTKEESFEKIKTKPFYLSIFDSLRNDKAFIMQALEYDKNAYFSVPTSMKNDIDIIQKALEKNIDSFEHLPIDYKKNKTFIKNVLLQKGELFRFIDKSLQQDEELVCTAALTYPKIWNLLSPELRKNPKVLDILVEKNPQTFKKLSTEYKNNPQMLSSVVQQSDFQADFLKGVDSQYLTNDFILQCVLKDADSFLYASEQQKKDKAFILKILSSTYQINILKYIDKELKNNEAFMKKAIHIHPEAFKYASLNIQINRKIVLTVIKKYPEIFPVLSQKFKMDKDIVHYALKNNNGFRNYPHVGYSLKRLAPKDDIEELKKIIQQMIDNEKNCASLDDIIAAKPEDTKRKVIKI
jgi:hypothetical protein